MKKNDIFILIGVILVAILLFFAVNFGKKSGNVAVVYINGEEYKRIFLSEDTEVDIKGKNTLKIENNEAYMIFADCPDKLCIKQGKIKNSKKSIVCLPNKVTVKIEE